MTGSTEQGITGLSERAKAVATKTTENLIWEVLDNQWHSKDNPDGYVSLGVAENRLMHSELQEYINKNLEVSQFGFTYGDGTTGSKVLRKSVARFINRHFKPARPIDMSMVTVTNGVSSAIEHCSWAFANQGDAFILGKPYYVAFLPDMSRRTDVDVITVNFGQIDPLSIEAVGKYEEEILKAKERGVTVKGLMLCSPHNPLSRCYAKEVLIEYMKLCQKYRIHLVSDEIYALSIWENKEDKTASNDFVSVLSIPLEGIIDSYLVHVLHGMSKDFCANGLRMGWIISPDNVAFNKTLKSITIQSSTSSITDDVVAKILSDDTWTDNYIKVNQQRLSESYSFVVKFLKQHQISYAPGANAGFFLWVDLGKIYLEKHPDRKSEDGSSELTHEIMTALLKHKVYISSGLAFGAETPGLFRIVFSHPTEYLEEGLERLIRAIED